MARIEISKDPSGRIIASFPYALVLVSEVKTIEGRRWQPAEKQRSFHTTLYPRPLWERAGVGGHLSTVHANVRHSLQRREKMK